jgi:8-oxo-dGTP pyrophosphatase MutT (NUDIX family)
VSTPAVDGHGYRVLARTAHFAGPMFSVCSDEVAMPDGQTATRDYMRHLGAVGVVALDDAGQVVLVRQYRHPVARELWELPAGLIDVAGEALAHAALRELAEEADLTAGRLDLLVDIATTPGCSDEMIRIFLARDLAEVPVGQRHEREHEEAGMITRRFPLDEAVAMIWRGEIVNAACVVGLLAAAAARAAGFTTLRAADTPFVRTGPGPVTG